MCEWEMPILGEPRSCSVSSTLSLPHTIALYTITFRVDWTGGTNPIVLDLNFHINIVRLHIEEKNSLID